LRLLCFQIIVNYKHKPISPFFRGLHESALRASREVALAPLQAAAGQGR